MGEYSFPSVQDYLGAIVLPLLGDQDEHDFLDPTAYVPWWDGGGPVYALDALRGCM